MADLKITYDSSKGNTFYLTPSSSSLSDNNGIICTGDLTVDWGDGTIETVSNPHKFNHTYSTNGTYNIIMSGNITGIGRYAFSNQFGINSVTIPNTVTFLDWQFLNMSSSQGTSSLTSLKFESSTPPSANGNYTFMNLPTSCTIYVPTGSLSAYTSASDYPSSSSYTYTEYSLTHDYALSFDEQSYFACDGSCTVSATLTDNNVGVSGETVTLTGLSSSVTATTDSNGVATFNLTNISEDKTLTVSFDEVSDTASLTYGLATLNGSLTCLGKRMASNLTAMGVTGVDYTDGLTSLADSILDIAPTITGIEFDTSITCSSSESSVVQGTQITLTGVLEADYNDTTVVDVDLEGYLSGATVKIYNGNTLLGSAITDSSGAYSFNYTPQTAGTMSIIAVFDGTTYFDTCSSSSVSVEVLASTTLSVTGTKNILSSADSESSTITATLSQGSSGVSGETLSYVIKHNTTTISSGSDTTDSNGQITFTYSATGVGDVDVIVSYGNLLQETYELEDCFMYIDWSTITSNWTATTISDRTIYTLASNYQVDVEMEWKYKNSIPRTFIGFGIVSPSYDATGMMELNGNNKNWFYHSSRANEARSISISPTVNTVFRIQTENLHTLKLYSDNNLIVSQASASSMPLNVRIDSFTSSPTTLEYLKVKPL